MKFLIKKSPDGFIKSVNDEISSILNRNFDSFFPEYIFNEENRKSSVENIIDFLDDIIEADKEDAE